MAPLSSLCHLQAVFWHGGLDWGRHVLALGASAALALPDGPWCDGLQRLVVSCSRLVGPSSLRVLSAAQQLELLGVAGIDNVQRDRRINAALKKVAAWAQQHANLRRLMLDVELEAEWPLAAAAFTATQRKRPQLCIQSFMDDIAFGAACGFNSKFACA